MSNLHEILFSTYKEFVEQTLCSAGARLWPSLPSISFPLSLTRVLISSSLHSMFTFSLTEMWLVWFGLVWFSLVWFGLVSTEKLPDTVCRLGSISLHLTSLLFNIPGLCPSNVTPFFIPLTLTFLEVLTCSQSWSRSASPPSPPSPPSLHLPSAAPFPPFLPPPFSPCSPPPLPSTLLHHSLTC